MTDESKKLAYEEYEDVLPRLIKIANDGNARVQLWLWTKWRECLDDNPKKSPPVELAQWIDSLLVKAIVERKKPEKVLKLFEMFTSKKIITLKAEERRLEKDVLLYLSVEEFLEQGMSLSKAIQNTANKFQTVYPYGADEQTIENIYKYYNSDDPFSD